MARATRKRTQKKKKLGRGRRVATGIDLGNFSVKIATIAGDDGGQIDVRKITVVHLAAPDGAEHEQELHERQKEAFVEALKKHGKLEGVVSLAFPRRLATVRYLTLPSCDPNELEEMLLYDVERHVPFSIEDLDVSYQVIEKTGEHETYLMMVCVPSKEIRPYINLCRELDVEVDRIDLDSLADCAAYSHTLTPEETVAIVNFGRSAVTLSIVQDKKLRFSRSLPVSETRLLKGFPGAKSWKDLQGRVTAMGALRPSEKDHFAQWVDQLSLELMRSASAFGCEHKEIQQINRMILTGGAGYFPAGPPRGLNVRIKTNTAIEAALNGEIPPSDEYHGTELTTAVGTALRALEMKKQFLNLLPKAYIDEQTQVVKSNNRKNILLLVFMMLVLMGGAGVLKWYELREYNNDIYELHETLMQEATELRAMKKRLNTVSLFIDREQSALNVIQGVIKVLPPKAYISRMSFSKKSRGRSQLEIEGQVITDADFVKLNAALVSLTPEKSDTPFFETVTPNDSIQKLELGVKDMTIHEFTFTCILTEKEESDFN